MNFIHQFIYFFFKKKQYELHSNQGNNYLNFGNSNIFNSSSSLGILKIFFLITYFFFIKIIDINENIFLFLSKNNAKKIKY